MHVWIVDEVRSYLFHGSFRHSGRWLSTPLCCSWARCVLRFDSLIPKPKHIGHTSDVPTAPRLAFYSLLFGYAVIAFCVFRLRWRLRYEQWLRGQQYPAE